MIITRDVASAQAKNCLLCIHIGGTCAMFFDADGWSAMKIEVLTEYHIFNFRRLRRMK